MTGVPHFISSKPASGYWGLLFSAIATPGVIILLSRSVMADLGLNVFPLWITCVPVALAAGFASLEWLRSGAGSYPGRVFFAFVAATVLLGGTFFLFGPDGRFSFGVLGTLTVCAASPALLIFVMLVSPEGRDS